MVEREATGDCLVAYGRQNGVKVEPSIVEGAERGVAQDAQLRRRLGARDEDDARRRRWRAEIDAFVQHAAGLVAVELINANRRLWTEKINISFCFFKQKLA